jgi:hypothetical protein
MFCISCPQLYNMQSTASEAVQWIVPHVFAGALWKSEAVL